jgi:DNA-binding response OmpR family regulator
MNVLIVDDDPQFAEAMGAALQRHGYQITQAPTASAALTAFNGSQMILMDLGLPDLDGHELCRRLRRETNVPIIVVTGRTEEVDLVMALHLGADDYVVKPFSHHELIARMEAVRRRAARSAVPERAAPAVLSFGELQVDLRVRQVHLDTRRVPVTRKEFDLLTLLLEDPGAVKTREEIISKVWDEHWHGSTRTLDVHVGSLRAKLGDTRWIETVRGVGYRIDRPRHNVVGITTSE